MDSAGYEFQAVADRTAGLERELAEVRRTVRALERVVAAQADELATANAKLRLETERRELVESDLSKVTDRLRAETVDLKRDISPLPQFRGIIGDSEPLRRVLRRVEQVAWTDACVLLTGETGTGKDLIARAIHDGSSRKNGSLVKVDCTALPPQLIETELFGHERGAFTGALSRRTGRFEAAEGGTIFLNEVGELPIELQAKLLRFLQEREFERVGSNQTLKVDVRVLAATNRDLTTAVARGSFRSDLFYRLSVFPIFMPPLRERRGDLPALVEHFVEKHQTKLGKRFRDISRRTMEVFEAYEWPGNIRELEHVIERAVIVSREPTLEVDDELVRPAAPGRSAARRSLEEIERQYILEVLERCGWKIKGRGNAADVLVLNPSTLRSKLKKLGICRPMPSP